MWRLLPLVAAVLLLAGCGAGLTPTVDPTHTPTVPEPSPTATATLTPTPAPGANATLVVSIGSGRFVVEIADDPDERSVGLSGREELADDAGMWFDLGSERLISFWMKGMRFPLDVVWVDASLNVVEVTHDVAPPAPDTPDAELPRFGPDVPVRYVLEINAGQAEKHGIGPGMRVRIESP